MKGKYLQTSIIILVFIALLATLIIGMMVKRPSEERYVLLSFDVEPVDGENNVTEVLRMLDAAEVNATFFVTGEYAEKYPAAMRMMARYEIGCHGYSHKKLTKMNTSEKKEEIEGCRAAVKKATGREITGFRAPYTRIDHETMMLLDKEGFTYDASIITGLSVFYPDATGHNIGEIPVSSVFGVPIEDVIWTYYLHLPKLYFYILENKDSELESYLFHPHHITRYKNDFSESISHLKERNVTFISHLGLIEKHEGV